MNKQITGLILAGGKAKRMGGIDKGLFVINEKYLISHVIQNLESQVEVLLINANRNIEIYKTFNKPIVLDLTDERLGPLGGIQAGLSKCETPYMISIPCDVPKIPLNICEKLYLKLLEEKADCAMPLTTDINGIERTHPAILLLKTNLVDSLNVFLDSGERKIDKWTRDLKCIEVKFENESGFININKPDDISSI